MIERRWKELGIFIGAMTLSGVVSVIVFPYMVHHIFDGYKGTQSFDALLHSSLVDNMKVFWQSGVDELYGGFAIAIVIVAVCFLLFYIFYENMCLRLGAWWIVLLPCILYFFTISKVAVESYVRYISPIYSICIVLLMGLFMEIVRGIKNERLSVIFGICFVGVLLNNSWKSYEWSELYKEEANVVKIAGEYGYTNECIYVFNNIWKSMPNYQEFIQYQSMSFIPNDNFELLNQPEYMEYDSVVVYLEKSLGEEKIKEILNDIISKNPNLTEYNKLYEYYYNTAYYLF